MAHAGCDDPTEIGEVMSRKLRATKARKKTAGRRSSDVFSPSKDHLARIALGLFAERPFEAVSIRDISKAAKINSSMIYYHFKDKRGLYRAAIESAIDEAFDLYTEHSNTEKYETPAEAIAAWFDVHVRLHKQLRKVIKISLDCKGLIKGVPDSKQPIKRFYRHEKAILSGLVREGIQSGLFRRGVDPATVATTISTMLDGMLARSMFLKDFDIHETVKAFKQAMLLYLGFRRETVGSARAARNSSALMSDDAPIGSE